MATIKTANTPAAAFLKTSFLKPMLLKLCLLIGIAALPSFAFAVDTDGDGVQDLATVAEGFEAVLSPVWTLNNAVRNTSANVTGSWGLRTSSVGGGSLTRTFKLAVPTTVTWYTKKTKSYSRNTKVVSQGVELPMTCSLGTTPQCSTTLAAGSYRLQWIIYTNYPPFPNPLEYTDVDDIVIPNVGDNCPLVANADQADNELDGLGNVCDSDDDNDTIPDGSDNCPLNANTNQADTDNDTMPDACTDTDDDNDGVADASDKFPLNAAASSDTDVDGFPGSWNGACDVTCQANSGLVLDNCPSNANADQVDTDGDTQGNACDSDDDNDGVADAGDAFPLNAAETLDTDNDGTGNNADPDDDNDGLPDFMDPLPLQAKFNLNAPYKGSQIGDQNTVQ